MHRSSLLFCAVIVCLLLGALGSTQAAAKEVPLTVGNIYGHATVTIDVSEGEKLTEFSSFTHHLSYIGYVRWRVWLEGGVWFPLVGVYVIAPTSKDPDLVRGIGIH